MNLSAMAFALILTAIQQPAYGDDLVVAAGDEYATEQQDAGPEMGPLQAAPTVKADGIDELAQFDRLFGAQDSKPLSTADQKIVDSASEAAWPWWVWPLGLFAIGVLLIVRSRVHNQKVPVEAIHVVSRQAMGKDGTLALIEVHDGDSRKRRLLVGLGGGSPRLVADVSAWEVAVAAPSNIANDAVAVVGPDPDAQLLNDVEERRASLHVATNSFGGQLKQAAERYTDIDTAPVSPPSKVESTSKRDLIEEVMASREQVRRDSVSALESEQTIRKAKRKPTYSSREILA